MKAEWNGNGFNLVPETDLDHKAINDHRVHHRGVRAKAAPNLAHHTIIIEVPHMWCRLNNKECPCGEPDKLA